MGIVRADMMITLDGYTSGPNQRLDAPFGDGVDHLGDWLRRTKSFHEMTGEPGGDTGPSEDVFQERMSNVGAFIMGRNMFGGGPGPWPTNPVWDGWWGPNPPYHTPVFVLTHHAREPQPMEGGTTFHFVTDGIQAAMAHAKAAAVERDIIIAGGGTTVRAYLAAGLVETLELHVAPLIAGAGENLFAGLAGKLIFEQVRAISDVDVTHLKYRVRPTA